MAKLVSEAGMATTDGMPLMLQGKLRGYDVTRVYGPDLVLALCERGLRPSEHVESGKWKVESEEHRTPNTEQGTSNVDSGITNTELVAGEISRKDTETDAEQERDAEQGLATKNTKNHEKKCSNAYPTQAGGVQEDLKPNTQHSTLNAGHRTSEERINPHSTAHDSQLTSGEAGGYRHYFYGSTDEVLAKLRANLESKFPGIEIVGMYSPPFRPLTEAEEEQVAEMINATRPDIVWCGLGTPKQDYWVAKFQPKVDAAAFIAVGAAFNFHAGEVKQAPRWMMRFSLEWLFRLVVEPKRLWKRYLVGNPRFVMLCLRQLWAEFRYGR
jgi:N-acetylglucosaminyldiphosphoundecaprenol N-acetyl-beta-D-mannosaminyltransferase